jgi:hypothetical protein
MKKNKLLRFVRYLKNENKNTNKGVTRLVIVVVALHVAYCLPPTLLQANKCSKNDLDHENGHCNRYYFHYFMLVTTYHIVHLQQQWLFFQS